MDTQIMIIKASGEKEEFDPVRLRNSLINAGAAGITADSVIKDINQWIKPGVTTRKIYSRAFALLKNYNSRSALFYRLKEAIFQLGPTGYPFEKFIGCIFERQGYKVETGVVVDGKCISHEMDVIAQKDSVQHLMECKYRLDQGKHISIQVPLYVRSRVDDVAALRSGLPEYKDFTFKGWVVTNTRFSHDSMQYSQCSGLNLLAWDYPVGSSLKDLIKKYGVYPVTILTGLTEDEVIYILDQGVVTCKGLYSSIHILDQLDMEDKRKKLVIQEIENICSG
jgi:hypothetical protein